MKHPSHEVDLKRVNELLGQYVHRCSLCQSEGTFAVLPKYMELREYGDGDIMLRQCDIVPLVVMTCQSCGNTVLINALAANLVDHPEEI